ncbi:MAG: flagellar hook-length control protein FliK [Nitrospirae bacterium]|nr:flagellar hook-length control protein FliK [Nitrospirota bacterium]
MTKDIGIVDTRSVSPTVSAAGKGVNVKAGTVVKAEVVDFTKDGNALLRIIPAGTNKDAMAETIIKAFSGVPLVKGQSVFLEVLGCKDNIRMQLVGDMKGPAAPLQQNIPVKFLDMLAGLSESKLGNLEFKDLVSMLKSLPESIKAAIPEFEGLEKLLLNAKELDGNLLRAFVETSGVAFETKLKIAVQSDPKSFLRNLIALQAGGDLKGLLIRLADLLKDKDVIQALRKGGVKISQLSDMVEKFTRNIEFFQLTSKIEDMFYTFLPLLWDGLKDSEFLFRKNKDGENDSYACDINLDLEKLGKLSVSVTTLDKAFYVSFFVEQPEIAAIISLEKKALKDRFAAQGLKLKAIHVNQKKDISFGKAQCRGINLTA